MAERLSATGFVGLVLWIAAAVGGVDSAEGPAWTHAAPGEGPQVHEGGSIDFRVVCEDADGDLEVVEWFRDGEFVASEQDTGASIDADQTIFFQDLGTREVQSVCRDVAGNSVGHTWRVEVRAAGEPLADAGPPGAPDLEGRDHPGHWLDTVYLVTGTLASLAALVTLALHFRRRP